MFGPLWRERLPQMYAALVLHHGLPIGWREIAVGDGTPRKEREAPKLWQKTGPTVALQLPTQADVDARRKISELASRLHPERTDGPFTADLTEDGAVVIQNAKGNPVAFMSIEAWESMQAEAGAAAREWPVVREENVLVGKYTDPATGKNVDVHGDNLRPWDPQRDGAPP